MTLRCSAPLAGRLRSSGPRVHACGSAGGWASCMSGRGAARCEPSVGAAPFVSSCPARSLRFESLPPGWAWVRGSSTLRVLVCGEGGIRTLGTVARTLDFQSSTFDHSVTSPGVAFFGAKRAESGSRGRGCQRQMVALARRWARARDRAEMLRQRAIRPRRLEPIRVPLPARAASAGVRPTTFGLGLRSSARPVGWGWP